MGETSGRATGEGSLSQDGLVSPTPWTFYNSFTRIVKCENSAYCSISYWHLGSGTAFHLAAVRLTLLLPPSKNVFHSHRMACLDIWHTFSFLSKCLCAFCFKHVLWIKLLYHITIVIVEVLLSFIQSVSIWSFYEMQNYWFI